MSMLFFDGFDGYDSRTDLTNYGGWFFQDDGPSNANPIVTSTRTGSGKAIYISHPLGYQYSSACIVNYLSADQSGKTLYVGFAFKGTDDFHGSVLVFKNQYTIKEDTGVQATLYYDPATASFRLYRNQWNSGTVLASTPVNTILKDVWYYFEVKYFCHNTTGVFELRINEAVVASYTGDTQQQTNDSIYTIAFGGGTETFPDLTADFYIDDVYILNSDGATNNTYLGDVQCTMLAPSADYSTTFTPTGAVSNYLCVDEAIGAPDNDTTYVSSSTVGAVDEYSIPNIVASSVHAVKVNTRAKKDDVNPRSMKHGIRTGTNANEVEYVLGEGYGNYIDVFDDQGDGTPWDETSFNAARSMIKVQS